MKGLHAFNPASDGILMRFCSSFNLAPGGPMMNFSRLSNCDLLSETFSFDGGFSSAVCYVKTLQLYPTLYTDCNPPDSSVPGLLQARILE